MQNKQGVAKNVEFPLEEPLEYDIKHPVFLNDLMVASSKYFSVR